MEDNVNIEEKRKVKFPAAAILLLIGALISLINVFSMMDYYQSPYVIMAFLTPLAVIATSIVMLTRKRGVLLAVLLCIMFLLEMRGLASSVISYFQYDSVRLVELLCNLLMLILYAFMIFGAFASLLKEKGKAAAAIKKTWYLPGVLFFILNCFCVFAYGVNMLGGSYNTGLYYMMLLLLNTAAYFLLFWWLTRPYEEIRPAQPVYAQPYAQAAPAQAAYAQAPYGQQPAYAAQTPAFCPVCGAKLDSGAAFCAGCGSRVVPAAPVYQQPYPVETDAPSGGFAALGFFFPLVGLILYLVWKDSTPLKARSAGKGALAGVITWVSLTIIIYLVYFIWVGSMISSIY